MDSADNPPVLLTRSRADNARLASMLRGHGVPVLAWSTSRARVVSPCEARATLPALVAAASVVVFTSRRGVLALRALLGSRLRALLADRRVAAVGPGTAALLSRLGASPAWVGDAGAAELGRRLGADLPAGTRVLLIRGTDAEEEPSVSLRDAGLLVEDRRVYRQEPPPPPRCAPRPLAAVACASPSGARRALGWHPWIAAAPFVAIGGTTAAALSELGIATIRVARVPTPESLCEAILETVRARGAS